MNWLSRYFGCWHWWRTGAWSVDKDFLCRECWQKKWKKGGVI